MLFSALTVAAAMPGLALRPQHSHSSSFARLAETLNTDMSDEMTFLKDASSVVNDILLQEGNATEHLTKEDKDLLSKVFDIIDNQMYGSMRDKHKTNKEDLDNRYDAIKECNADITARQSATGDLGKLHHEAVVLQTELNGLQAFVDEKTIANNSAWAVFENHMVNVIGDPPACPDFPNPRGMAQLDVYFEKSLYSIWWQQEHDRYFPPRQDWIDADAELRAAIRAFNIQKAKLDVKYCDYKAELEAACASYDKCYAEKVASYNEKVAWWKLEVPKNLAIVKAGETLKAQVRFLLAQQKTRDTPPYSTDEWLMTYKPVPDKALCDLTTLTTGWSHTINCEVCEQGFGIGHTFGVKSWLINGKCANAVAVNAGDSVDVHIDYESWEHGCSGCIEQMYVGIRGQKLDCIYNGNPNGHLHDDHTLTLANLAKGTYQIVAASSWQFSCVTKTDGRWIGTVHVE